MHRGQRCKAFKCWADKTENCIAHNLIQDQLRLRAAAALAAMLDSKLCCGMHASLRHWAVAASTAAVTAAVTLQADTRHQEENKSIQAASLQRESKWRHAAAQWESELQNAR